MTKTVRDSVENWSAEFQRTHLVDDVFDSVRLIDGPALAWSSALETGIRIIDADHRDLVKLINLLALSVERSRPIATLRLLIDQFNQYAVEHFMREEDLMQRCRYPDVHAHSEKHVMFRRMFHAIRIVLRESPDSIQMEKVLGFLKEWLQMHIGRSDMDYVVHLQTAGWSYAPDLSDRHIEELLRDARAVLKGPKSEAVELARSIQELRLKSAMDIGLDEALKLLMPFRSSKVS